MVVVGLVVLEVGLVVLDVGEIDVAVGDPVVGAPEFPLGQPAEGQTCTATRLSPMELAVFPFHVCNLVVYLKSIQMQQQQTDQVDKLKLVLPFVTVVVPKKGPLFASLPQQNSSAAPFVLFCEHA